MSCLFALFRRQAQVQNGQIIGVIADPSGADYKRDCAHSNLATGYKVDFESNGSGLYTAPEMIVGSYTIQVEAPGFKTVIATGIVDQCRHGFPY